MPKVSVIVPIYDVEPYLRECIDSVLRQTYHDYELILVDDGSPDNCGTICDIYAVADERIRVIHKANGGLSDARNAGLNIAKGKYIYFLDSDDTIEPSLLETVVPYMDAGMDMVCFNYYFLYSERAKEIKRIHTRGEFITNSEAKRKDFIIKVLTKGKVGWDAWSRIYAREIIEKYGLRFADNRKIFAEDLYFCLCYCAHANRILSIDAFLYNYRIRENSIMGAQKNKNNLNRINDLGKAVLAYYQQYEDCKMLVSNFYIIHSQITVWQFVQDLWKSDEHPDLYRENVLNQIDDRSFLEDQIRLQYRDKKTLATLYSDLERADYKYYIRFLLGEPWKNVRVYCKLIRLFTDRVSQWKNETVLRLYRKRIDER